MSYPDANTFRGLRKQNVDRDAETYGHLAKWTPADYATAMAGECGEACNLVKKLRRLDDGDKPWNEGVDADGLRKQIGYELADLVIYADLLAARLDIDLGNAVVEKFNAVSERVGSKVKLPY